MSWSDALYMVGHFIHHCSCVSCICNNFNWAITNDKSIPNACGFTNARAFWDTSQQLSIKTLIQDLKHCQLLIYLENHWHLVDLSIPDKILWQVLNLVSPTSINVKSGVEVGVHASRNLPKGQVHHLMDITWFWVRELCSYGFHTFLKGNWGIRWSICEMINHFQLQSLQSHVQINLFSLTLCSFRCMLEKGCGSSASTACWQPPDFTSFTDDPSIPARPLVTCRIRPFLSLTNMWEGGPPGRFKRRSERMKNLYAPIPAQCEHPWTC